MTIKTRLAFVVTSFQQIWWEGSAEAYIRMTGLVERAFATKGRKRFGVAAAVCLLGLRGENAYASGGGGGGTTGSTSGCTDSTTSPVVSVLQKIGVLMYAIAGIFALLAFAGIAMMLFWSGKYERHAERALRWGRNVVIGLFFLAGGFAARNIVVDFIGNSGAAVSTGNNDTSIPSVNSSLTACQVQ